MMIDKNKICLFKSNWFEELVESNRLKNIIIPPIIDLYNGISNDNILDILIHVWDKYENKTIWNNDMIKLIDYDYPDQGVIVIDYLNEDKTYSYIWEYYPNWVKMREFYNDGSVDENKITGVDENSNPIIPKSEDILEIPEIEDFNSNREEKDNYIRNFIDQNMKDDSNFEKILNEAFKEPEVMPSCLTLGEYTNIEIIESYEKDITDYDIAIRLLERDKEEFIKHIKDLIQKNYENEYLPRHRRELRKWYNKRKENKLKTIENE